MAVSFQGFRSLVENSPDAISLIDTRGEILYGSLSSSKIFGYQPDEIVGRNCLDLIHPEDRHRLSGVLRDVLAEPPGPLKWDARVRHKDGSYCWVESTVSNLLFEPEVQAIVIHQRDINARRIAEEHSRQQALELARSNLRLTEFARTVAHDLREPLTAVSWYAEVFAQGAQEDSHVKVTAAAIVESVRYMADLVESLLFFANTGLHEPLRSVDLADAVSQATRNLAPLIEATSARITVGELPAVRSSPIDLVRLLQNLMGNALKYRSERQPEIHITATRRAAEWVVKIADNGIGIPSEEHLRVFLPFVRLANPRAKGYGLGLAVSKNIVEALGGTLWLESEFGIGSTFCFTLGVQTAATALANSGAA
jgi:PAS domain S-box-containing protein